MSLKIVLVQLPIPPLGPEAVRGNVPLAAGYLKYYCQQVRRLPVEIEILPPELADRAGDSALVQAILERQPDVVGFSCYVWNAERSVELARRLRRACPSLRVVMGGPEATLDNSWFLRDPLADWLVLGEGEESFAELVAALLADRRFLTHPGELPDIAGVWNSHHARYGGGRPQLRSLDEVGQVYLAGIIDPAWHDTLFLETVRGCIFKCSFCFYPKSFDKLAFMSREVTLKNLELARKKRVSEVFLLDPTLNQRRDFEDFLRVLAEGNPERSFTYSGELRAEGIRPAHAQLMREAGFVEVELGLQSVGRQAQDLMHRRVNLAAFERGVKALMDAGIHVRVDLIIGLPGDTAESIRAGIEYLTRSGLYHEPQVFRLSVLPGTEFRRRSEELGLEFQQRPPYHVLSTPTLQPEEIEDLMAEAEAAFGTEFDPWPISDERFSLETLREGGSVWEIDLDNPPPLPDDETVQIAHSLWIRAKWFSGRGREVEHWVDSVLEVNPHSTLWVVLDVTRAKTMPRREDILRILDAFYRHPRGYWDWHLSLHSKQGKLGAKRLVIYSGRRLGDVTDKLEKACYPVADIIEAATESPQRVS